MPLGLHVLAAVLVTAALAAGCSAGSLPVVGGSSRSDGGPADLAKDTCWSGDLLGSDPQDVLKLSSRYGVPYLVAARAIDGWPSFDRRESCDDDHVVEVFKIVRLPDLDAQLTDYAALLRGGTPLREAVARRVTRACMTDQLAKAAARTGLPGAVMAPQLPEDATLGWAPAPGDQWGKGRREFACTLTWSAPQDTRYRTVFTKSFPTGERTCIDSRSLVFVDCARKHDRERIAVIDARQAVAAGKFPGPQAVRQGPQGRYLDVGDDAYRKLDAACTAYLRAISTTKKLSGVANVDADEWPKPDGSYPIYCDADRKPDQTSLITTGSVYDRS